MSFTEDLAEIVEKDKTGLLGAHSTWPRVPLGSVAKVLNGFPFESKFFTKHGGVPLLRIRDMLRESTDTKYNGPIPHGYWVHKGDLLVGMDGDFNCARWGGAPALLNQRVCKLIPDPGAINPTFLFRVLGGYLNAVNVKTSSTTVKHLSSRTIAELPLPYPPLDEQARIANKLEAMLAYADTFSRRLDRVPLILKKFHEAILEAAVSGKLTEEWRKAKRAAAWQSHKAGELCDVITKGTTPVRGFVQEGIPFLKVYNIVDQQLAFKPRSQFVSSATHENELSRSKTFPGDVLMNIVGPPLGKVALVTDDFPEWNINQALALFRPGTKITGRWLYVVLRSGINLRSIIRETRGMVGQANISLAQCREFDIPVPSLREQAESIRRVETMFALADNIRRKYDGAIAASTKLTPSILAKTFRGELVPQDPSDEPAEEMLERIRAARPTRAPIMKIRAAGGRRR